jgi:hypothetical protein
MLFVFLWWCCCILSISINSQCVNTQSYWLSNVDKWPPYMINTTYFIPSQNLTMCGSTFLSIMQVEPLRMTIKENMYWVSAFHQYCISQLNLIKLFMDNAGNNTVDSSSSSSLLTELTNGLMVLGDSLSRYCSTMDQYALSVDNNKLYYYAEMLHLFSTGALGGVGLCKESMNITKESSLYYNHNPDVIIIPFINVTNMETSNIDTYNETYNFSSPYLPRSIFYKKLTYSLLEDAYRIRVFLLSAAIILFLIVLIEFAIILFMRERNRNLLLNKPIKQEYMVPSTSTNDIRSLNSNPLMNRKKENEDINIIPIDMDDIELSTDSDSDDNNNNDENRNI